MLANHVSFEGVRREGLRIEEFGQAVGIGRTKVFDLIREGRVRAVKIGTRTIIPRSEVDRLLSEANNGTTDDAV